MSWCKGRCHVFVSFLPMVEPVRGWRIDLHLLIACCKPYRLVIGSRHMIVPYSRNVCLSESKYNQNSSSCYLLHEAFLIILALAFLKSLW